MPLRLNLHTSYPGAFLRCPHNLRRYKMTGGPFEEQELTPHLAAAAHRLYGVLSRNAFADSPAKPLLDIGGKISYTVKSEFSVLVFFRNKTKSGYSAVGSARGSGPRGRGFKSRYSDQTKNPL